MNLRRVLSLLLLLAAVVSVVEPVIGEARDAAIHHEEQATTVAFCMVQSPADHAHEDPSAPGQSQGESHHHGSSSDHCTHQHGVGVPAHLDVAFLHTESLQLPVERPFSADRIPRTLFRPPRA